MGPDRGDPQGSLSEAEPPPFLSVDRHRDLRGRERVPWQRRSLFLLLVAVPAAGLANVFGQQPVASRASGVGARLQVFAAEKLRGGLLGQAMFRITARRDLHHATLVLDRGWTEGMQLNTIVPNPLGQASRGDRLALDFGHVPTGETLVARIQFQVNPTAVGIRPRGSSWTTASGRCCGSIALSPCSRSERAVDIVLRAAVVYFLILFVTRVAGRRELSSLQPFDLILLVVIGDLVQQGVTQSDYSVTGVALALSTFAVLTVATSYASYKFPRARPLLDGEPVIIVEDGKLIEHNLRRERLTSEEVAEEARQQQIASLADVQWAVLESNGKISFLPKQR